jgi:hypothetical protein
MAEEKVAPPPYAIVADIDSVFSRLRNIPDPGEVTNGWLVARKLASNTQPGAVKGMLQWLGVVNVKGVTVDGVWDQLRAPQTRRETLEKLVQVSYAAVFEQFDDISEATKEDLEGAFISAYRTGSPTRPLGCFVALCRHAGIELKNVKVTSRADKTPAKKDKEAPRPQTGRKSAEKTAAGTRDSEGSSGVPAATISLSVQIPPEWTQEQIRERILLVRRALAGGDDDAA